MSLISYRLFESRKLEKVAQKERLRCMGKNLNLCPIILENKTEEKKLVIGRNCVFKVSNWSFEATVFSEGKILNDRSSNYISEIQKKKMTGIFTGIIISRK